MIFSSTPAGGGTFSAELWERAETVRMGAVELPSVAGGWIKPEYVEQARQTMDPSLWRQEFFGSIESLLGAVYPAFNQQNISDTVDNGGPLLVGCDFNRSPFCGCILQVQGDVVVVLEEIVLMEADTREFALAVRERVPAADDPLRTGSHRQPEADQLLGLSDHKILQETGGFKICSPRAPWAIKDKVNATWRWCSTPPAGVGCRWIPAASG